jgi:hypothetical protein
MVPLERYTMIYTYMQVNPMRECKWSQIFRTSMQMQIGTDVEYQKAQLLVHFYFCPFITLKTHSNRMYIWKVGCMSYRTGLPKLIHRFTLCERIYFPLTALALIPRKDLFPTIFLEWLKGFRRALFSWFFYLWHAREELSFGFVNKSVG